MKRQAATTKSMELKTTDPQSRLPFLASLLAAGGAALLVAASGQASPPPGSPYGASASTASQRLVPAGYGSRTDKKGNVWNFQQNGVLGRAGNSMLNTGLSLRINNQNFYNYQPMMTSDGKEYVLQHSHPQQMMGLQVSRRIRFYENEGVARYLEVISNPGGHDITISLDLQSSFSGNYKTYISDRGNEKPTTLDPKESSLIVMPSSTNYTKSFVFSLCSPKSVLKPSLSNQNQYSLSFHFNITVPAGQTVCVMHAVAQVPKPDKLDSKTLAKHFKSVSLNRFLKALPTEYRGVLANYSSGSGFGGLALLASTSVEGLGVERAKQDVLAMGEKTRLLGKASCGKLQVTSTYGEVEIPFEQVAALVGGDRGRSEGGRVFLRDGQVFSGKIQADSLRFVMPSGARMNLDVRSLDRLVRSRTPEEGKWDPKAGALLETFSGERLSLAGSEEVFLSCVTPWGAMDFSLDEVLWISPPEEEPVGHFIELKDGSRFFAFLAGPPLKLRSRLFGECLVKPQEIRALITRSQAEKSGQEEERMIEDLMQQPHLLLAGGQRLVGQISAPSLNIITNSEILEAAPEAVRLMHNMSEEVEASFEDTPPFQIELWGGGVVLGYIREPVIPVQVRGREWRIPIQDVVSVISPQPRISDTARASIARLIRELGDDDWRIRENAMEELREYGYLAKSLLVDALRVSNDAEVKRRLEQLVNAIE